MFFFFHKYLRRFTLALTLLLAASANCLCVTYDSDEDDDVPPVKVELNFVVPGGKTTQAREIGSTGSSSSLQSLQLWAQSMARHDRQRAGAMHEGSPQLLIPLRR